MHPYLPPHTRYRYRLRSEARHITLARVNPLNMTWRPKSICEFAARFFANLREFVRTFANFVREFVRIHANFDYTICVSRLMPPLRPYRPGPVCIIVYLVPTSTISRQAKASSSEQKKQRIVPRPGPGVRMTEFPQGQSVCVASLVW